MSFWRYAGIEIIIAIAVPRCSTMDALQLFSIFRMFKPVNRLVNSIYYCFFSDKYLVNRCPQWNRPDVFHGLFASLDHMFQILFPRTLRLILSRQYVSRTMRSLCFTRYFDISSVSGAFLIWSDPLILSLPCTKSC